MMPPIIFLPIVELAAINLFTADRCCSRKYSGKRTFLTLFLFSAALFLLFWALSPALSLRGDGKLSAAGFLYLIPLGYLYKEKRTFLFILICNCWVYTLGILALSLQITGVILPDSTACLLAVENLLFLLTISPFYRWILPKYRFILGNFQYFEKKWYRYLTLNNCLNFLALLILNLVFVSSPASPAKITVLLLLLASTYASYFILYKIIQDAIKMNQLEYTVFHDTLTGLGNRARLWNHLDDMISENQTFSVLFMDLDHFKQINDRYGHMIGDQYLKHFAEVVSRILSDHGQLYRFGGDEFVAVCTGIVPQEIVEEIQKCREWDDHAPCPFNQVSVGVLFCQPPHQDAEQILQQVDRLMYQQKMDKKRAVQA